MNLGNIYVTGFMGSGKSTVGPLLARDLKYTFVDLDKEIEKREGLAINEIFEQKGENYFRRVEHQMLTEYTGNRNLIIALGGGALIWMENYVIIRQSGVIIYLAAQPEEIYQRLSNNHNRPLLNNKKTKEEFIQQINALMKKRLPGYRRAEIKVKTDQRSPQDIVRRIIVDLRGRNLLTP